MQTPRLSTTLGLLLAVPLAGCGSSLVGGGGGGDQTSFSSVSTGLAGAFVLSTAADATGSTIYLGTSANGIYRSIDGGSSWTAVSTGLPDASTTNTRLGKAAVHDLLVDPSNSSLVYAATALGLYRTTNGGIDWAAMAALAGVEVSALALDPNDPATVYAGTTSFGVFKSTDNGFNWFSASTGLSGQRIQALALARSTPSTLYAGTATGVFVTTDGGTSWNGTTGGPTTAFAIAVDPNNSQIVYAGALSGGVMRTADGGGIWVSTRTGIPNGFDVQSLLIDRATPTTLYVSLNGGGVYKTTDSGANWAAAHTGIGNHDVESLARHPGNGSVLFAGTGGGVYTSSNAGSSWSALNSGLAAPDARDMVGDPTAPATLYAGTAAGVFKTLDHGASWAAVNTGLTNLDVDALALDPTSTLVLYAGTERHGVFKTTDGGANWSLSSSGVTDLQIQAIAIDPQTPATVYVGTQLGGVFKTTNGGTSWTAMNTGLLTLVITSMVVDRQTAGAVYAGTIAGVYKSTDGGANWVFASNGGGINNRQINALVIDPLTPTTIYAATDDRGVFKSTDSAGFWTRLVTGLEASNITDVAVESASPNVLYAASPGDANNADVAGVFVSTDGAQNWARWDSGLTRVTAVPILVTSQSRVYAGTLGGGVFRRR